MPVEQIDISLLRGDITQLRNEVSAIASEMGDTGAHQILAGLTHMDTMVAAIAEGEPYAACADDLLQLKSSLDKMRAALMPA